MDTTSLSFTGAGGATLGAQGYSKDHRPDLMYRPRLLRHPVRAEAAMAAG